MNDSFTEAIQQEVVWKSGEVHAFAVAFVKRLLELRRENIVGYGGTDDVREEDQPDGRGIAGSVCELLKNAKIIEHYYGSQPAEGIVHGRRRSKRKDANGRKVDLYRLTNHGIAEAFLRRHGIETTRQAEFATMVSR